MNSVYPEAIMIEGETLNHLKKHSELIAILLDNQGDEASLELDAETLFGGDREKWKLFLDLFFPEEGYAKLFDVTANKKLKVKNARGGEEALMDMLHYMMVNEPGKELNFAKNQALLQINAPAVVEPRGVGVRAPLRYVRRNNANLYPHNFENNNPWRNNNTHENNENNVKVGYTNEEEAMLGKLKGKMAKNYYPNEGGKRRGVRRTRKTRKAKRAARKTRRVQTRRVKAHRK
jgi:hypothetical protein